MKNCICFSVITITFIIVLNATVSAGQDVPVTPTEERGAELNLAEPLKISLNVSEVRLDVVVLDGKGNPVKDLTADDFEVFQDDVRQKVLSSVYIVNQSVAAASLSASGQVPRNLTLPPAAYLKKEDVSRTIIFIVDDLSMNFENGYYARMSLRNFVEKQMEPDDMTAILRTGYGNSALQMFVSDKREALARIDAMRMERALSANLDGSDLKRIYDNQLYTLSYCLHALEDMPGRKILNMLTAFPTIRVPPPNIMSMGVEEVDFDVYNERFGRLADDALRAGVVVNFLNIDGLNRQLIDSGGGGGEFAILGADASMPNPHNLLDYLAYQQKVREEIKKTENANRGIKNPLPAKTGGVVIENSNFFFDGTGRDVDNLMKGYYLVSYIPPEGTFGNDEKEMYHRIKVNVKRRNTQVHTRDGFYNSIGREKNAGAPVAHPLQDAVFSPFMYADLNVNIAAGYVRNAKAGYLVWSWIHLDPKDVTIVESEEGGARINLETVCFTSDINGNVHDFTHAQYTFTVDAEKKSENLAWIRKHGIRFAMLLPVKSPGSYYVRVATQDKESGKVGSAYQFVEIPDLDRKRLALSNIFIVTGSDNLNWLFSDATEGVFSPVFQAEEAGSPALRMYAIGDRLQTLTMVYNADAKAVAGSEIELQPVLYKDGEEYIRISPMPVRQAVAGNLEGIPVSLTVTGGSDIPPGDYVLQLVVTDKKNGGRQGHAVSQSLSFTILEK